MHDHRRPRPLVVAVDQLSSAIGGLGDEGITAVSASSAVTAIEGVGQAADALATTLTETCG